MTEDIAPPNGLHLPEIAPFPVPLEPYIKDGELCPTDALVEKFFMQVWRDWKAVPRPDYLNRKVTIFAFDFSAVERLGRCSVVDAILPLWSIQACRLKGVYSTLEGIKPAIWDQLDQDFATRFRTPKLGVARREGMTHYHLLGQPGLVTRYSELFTELEAESGWVAGGPFARQRLGQISTDALNQLWNLGAVIKTDSISNRPYFHRLAA